MRFTDFLLTCLTASGLATGRPASRSQPPDYPGGSGITAADSTASTSPNSTAGGMELQRLPYLRNHARGHYDPTENVTFLPSYDLTMPIEESATCNESLASGAYLKRRSHASHLQEHTEKSRKQREANEA